MKSGLRVLFVASECAPYAKVGGLGDVVGALPKGLRANGVDVRVLLPRYGSISTDGMARQRDPLGVPLGDGEAWCAVYETELGGGVPLYLLEHDALFGGPVYDGFDGEYGLIRFGLLSRAAFQLCRALDWRPDVMHVHDWPSAPAAMMLNTVEAIDFADTASVLSIHNLAHQPRFNASVLSTLHLPKSVFVPEGIEDFGELNPLKGGCWHATMLTTVSPNYAKEIQSDPGGAGLHDVMSFRKNDLVGIVNGIDTEVWNPATDPHLPAHYDVSNLQGKADCKAALQRELDLPVVPDAPLIGVVSRFAHQKGIDIIIDALDSILELGAQMVVLGSGDPDLEGRLAHRSFWGGEQFRARAGFDEALAHRIEAGADLLLMPSRFEPCGLNQLYSQRYGTLPIVRATGGLDDTVDSYDADANTGTGFKFWDLTPEALVDTVTWAVSVYRDAPERFADMQRRAMTKTFDWGGAAERYVEVYEAAMARRRSG